MVAQIETAYRDEYNDNLQLLLQQQGSKLRDTISFGSYVGSEGARAVDQIGPVEAQEVTDRNGDTKYTEVPHDGVWIYPTYFDVASLIDKIDKMKMGITLEGGYSRAHAFGAGRFLDDLIITAFFADMKTGKKGGTSTTFDTASHQILQSVGSTTNLNVDKLLRARKIFGDEEVDLDAEPPNIGHAPSQEEALMGLTEVTSGDYNAPVLMDGKLNSFLGFNFHKLNRYKTTSDPYRRNPVWVASGMHLGMWQDIQGMIDILPGKRHSIQLRADAMFGATRTEAGKVLEILCQE